MDIFTAMLFLKAHWDTVILIATFGTTAFQVLQSKAYAKFGLLCLDLVKEVALTELSSVDKRKAVIGQAFVMAPAWVKALVTQDQAEHEAEKAYQLLKGELGASQPTTPVAK